MTQRLGPAQLRVQRHVLEQIATQDSEDVARGEAWGIGRMLGLGHGPAAYSFGRYLLAVEAGVAEHNAGLCGEDCPVPRDRRVVAGHVGPRGAKGFFVRGPGEIVDGDVTTLREVK